MSFITLTKDCSDYLLLATSLKNNAIETNTLEAFKQLKNVFDYSPHVKNLCDAVHVRITTAALNCGLFFRNPPPLALISGAGIAGLTASFELRAKGFRVVIVEKRNTFSRCNIINLNVEIQAFLKRFSLKEAFEKSIAARIQEHRYILIDKNHSPKRLALSDVSTLQLDESISFEPHNFHRLFTQDGIYSVSIAGLQTFLAEKALAAGVTILGGTTVKIVSRTHLGGVSKAQITFDRTVQPDLFFISEGVHSTTIQELGIKTTEMKNACTGENWVFGNMTYSGTKNHVISLIDASAKTLQIANVIFNSKNHIINIAVTSDTKISPQIIQERILQIAHYVFAQKVFPCEEPHSTLLKTVSKPVHITNRISSPCTIGNVFCIGDTAGSSSPLAGLGGTLGLTLVPRTIRQLLDDYEKQSPNMHAHFTTFSQKYTSRWIQKSDEIKQFCINTFHQERFSI